jgi:hypothetical protein
MNTIRMFVFIAALLITAFLFRLIADGFASEEQPPEAATAAHAPAASGGPISAAD